jgi:hypothetical protein
MRNKMSLIDKKTIILNHGEKEVSILVYLKKVNVKSNATVVKAYCKIVD